MHEIAGRIVPSFASIPHHFSIHWPFTSSGAAAQVLNAHNPFQRLVLLGELVGQRRVR